MIDRLLETWQTVPRRLRWMTGTALVLLVLVAIDSGWRALGALEARLERQEESLAEVYGLVSELVRRRPAAGDPARSLLSTLEQLVTSTVDRAHIVTLRPVEAGAEGGREKVALGLERLGYNQVIAVLSKLAQHPRIAVEEVRIRRRFAEPPSLDLNLTATR